LGKPGRKGAYDRENARNAEIDEESNEMMDRLVKRMAESEGITEQLKSDEWL
jgi:hypothetical protein